MPRAFCPECGAEVPVDEHGTCHVGHTVDLAAATVDDGAVDLAADATAEQPVDAADAEGHEAEDEPQPWIQGVDDEDADAQDGEPAAAEPTTAVPDDAAWSPEPAAGAEEEVDLDAVEAAVAELEETGAAGDVEIGAPEEGVKEDAEESHDEWLAPFSEGEDAADDVVADSTDDDVPTWEGIEPGGAPAGQAPAPEPGEEPDAEAGTDEEQPSTEAPPPAEAPPTPEPDEEPVAAEAGAEVAEETEDEQDEQDEEPITPSEVGIDPSNFTARGERVGGDTRWSLLDIFRR